MFDWTEFVPGMSVEFSPEFGKRRIGRIVKACKRFVQVVTDKGTYYVDAADILPVLI